MIRKTELVLGCPLLPAGGSVALEADGQATAKIGGFAVTATTVGPWSLEKPFIHCAPPTDPVKVVRLTCTGKTGFAAWLRHKPLGWDNWPSLEELEELGVQVQSPELLSMFRQQLMETNYVLPRVAVTLFEGDSVSFFSNAFVKFAGGPFLLEEVWTTQASSGAIEEATGREHEEDQETPSADDLGCNVTERYNALGGKETVYETFPDKLEIKSNGEAGCVAMNGKAEIRLREDGTLLYKRRVLRSETGFALNAKERRVILQACAPVRIESHLARIVYGWEGPVDAALW